MLLSVTVIIRSIRNYISAYCWGEWNCLVSFLSFSSCCCPLWSGVDNKNTKMAVSVSFFDSPFLLGCIYISLCSVFTLTSWQIHLPPIYLHPLLLHFITRHNFFSARDSLRSPPRWQPTGDITLWWLVDFKCCMTGVVLKYCIIAGVWAYYSVCVGRRACADAFMHIWEYVQSCRCACLGHFTALEVVGSILYTCTCNVSPIRGICSPHRSILYYYKSTL